jgi:hypothetical protein
VKLKGDLETIGSTNPGSLGGGMGKPKLQPQGKPGGPGDRLVVLVIGQADNSHKSKSQYRDLM